ncbi:MAG: hypothetical protein A2150_01545 [Candidatus Muproteobacteria bacterium RBG_16_64_11]|uniref:Regulatory protein RecX n=1 Tax=Candidatus Muproteobacteria bacterium RBG_16_64_11 TaxID=1817758 RepID=A0A1F6THZ2_9PROT|nr:MAG: hypothetical protein A2150_01545 [Candidatus Muproteobacteria bacterium RBG_16_64_11]
MAPDFDPARARQAALDWLARREHSVAELAAKLIKKGCADALARRVTGEMQREGLVSDERFTEMLVRARRARGFGPLWIKRELQEKGVAGELIADRLDISGHEWKAEIRRVRQKKFGSKQPKDFAERARQARFLHYRGFTHDQIRSAFGRDALI